MREKNSEYTKKCQTSWQLTRNLPTRSRTEFHFPSRWLASAGYFCTSRILLVRFPYTLSRYMAVSGGESSNFRGSCVGTNFRGPRHEKNSHIVSHEHPVIQRWTVTANSQSIYTKIASTRGTRAGTDRIVGTSNRWSRNQVFHWWRLY